MERVTTGRNPGTGEIDVYTHGNNIGQPKIPSAATRFISHRDQLNAIYRAKLVFRRNDLFESTKPIDFGRRIGEGYKRDGLQYNTYDHAIVILKANGDPITAYTGPKK